MPDESSRYFPTTSLSLVAAAKSPDGAEHAVAMKRLAAVYWKPVFYFLRARGHRWQQAEDLTQEFFVKLLERDWIARFDPARGRFRTFLLAVLERFVVDQGPRAPGQQRFDARMVRISELVGEEERTFEPAGHETPEKLFMKHWAASVVASARRQLEAWCSENNHADWQRVFTAVHFAPPGGKRPSQETLAERLGVSRDQVRYGLKQADRRFVELLRSEVGGQVGSEEGQEEIDAEIRELERLLGE